MWPCVNTAVSSRAGDHARTDSCTRGVEHAARVDDHETVGGREHGRVGERLHERDARLHLGELTGAAHRVVLVDRRVAGVQPVGQLEQIVGHAGSLPALPAAW